MGFLLLWRWMEVSAFCLLFQSVPLYGQLWIRYCSLRASTSMCTDKHTQSWGLSVHQLLCVFWLSAWLKDVCMWHIVRVTYCTKWKRAVLILIYNETTLWTVSTNLSFLSRIYLTNTEVLNLTAGNSVLLKSTINNICFWRVCCLMFLICKINDSAYQLKKQ